MEERDKAIRADKSSGMSEVEIAKKYGLDAWTIADICKNVKDADSIRKTELWRILESAADELGGYGVSQITRAYHVVSFGKAVSNPEYDWTDNPDVPSMVYVPFDEIPWTEWESLPKCGRKTLRLLCKAFPEKVV